METIGPDGMPSPDIPPTSRNQSSHSVTDSASKRQVTRQLWLSVIFLGLLVCFAVLITVLVREGAPLALALAVPPAIIGAAASAVVFLRNLFESRQLNEESRQAPDEPRA
jgi:hypothetical protein